MSDLREQPMNDELKPIVRTGGEPQIRSSELVRRPVVALGYQAADGTIVVTDVLCMNFPDMTNDEMAKLSWQLDQWSRNFRR